MSAEWLSRHSLAANVRSLAAGGHRVLLVTSCSPGEGKSTVTADLGKALASTGREGVALIDADPVHPALHRLLQLSRDRGLAELLEEVYQIDLVKEGPDQFGVGDWLEILRAQRRTGELSVRQGQLAFSIRIINGTISSITASHDEQGLRLGEILVRRELVSSAQRDEALRLQQETGRPVGEILTMIGVAIPSDVGEALKLQARHRLMSLIGIQHPRCEFLELAERYLPAAGGQRTMNGNLGMTQVVDAELIAALPHPFLASQVPSYFSDTSQRNLKVITAGRSGCDLMDSRCLDPFIALLQRMASLFDVVLIDAPAATVGTTAVLSGLTDGVLLVVKSNGADARDIKRTIEELNRGGAKVLGVILNQLDLRRHGAYSDREHSDATSGRYAAETT